MKAGGTYPDIVQGVSNKEPQHRRAGQTTEQVNLLSDPVHGLVRRRGTRFAASIPVTLTDPIRAELNRMDVFDFTQEGRDYALLYRREASASGSGTFAFLYDKTGEEFLPINYEASTWVDNLVSGGAASLAAIGRYVYIAGNTTLPAAEQNNPWEAATNLQRLAVWFRVGKYTTTYKVSLVRADGTKLTKQYTTKPSAYPGVLDTTGIDFFEVDGTTPRPDYQKDVNDAVNAYNSAVNEWIKEAAEDIVPENIADKISDEFLLDGVIVTTVENGGLLFNDPEFVDIEVDDGGDNTTVYKVGKEITDATLVTKYHWHGKIVRVRPSGGGADEAFYLQARLDNGDDSGYGAVSWFEAAGITATITNFVSQLIIHGGEAYVAQNGAGLTALAPASGDHPELDDRAVGDGVTSPLPWFIGKQITMLAVFQDRLIVGSENYTNGSRAGDYLNFFRGSVVSIVDDDPVEVFAHGSEGDVLRHAVLYNGNLIIFGQRQQYGISGDQLLSPRSPLIRAISANKDSTDAKATVSGNFIFYPQHGIDETTSMHQMRVGALNGQDTITDELTEELGNWLTGQPLQIVTVTAPNFVMFRTAGQASSFYLYRYEDSKNNGQRLVASWHKFAYHADLGTIIGISSYKKAGIVFTARNTGVVADIASFSAEPDTHGAIDSRVPYASYEDADVADGSVVSNATSEHFLLGCPLDGVAEFIEQLPEVEDSLEFGVVSEAWVIPTNPFPRDQNGQAVLDGRMALNRVSVDVKNTAGMIGEVSTKNGVIKTTDFEGRILGTSENIIAAQPVYNGKLSIGIGREITECYYTIRSKDWLPMQVTGLAWTGQTFNNVRRVS